MKISELIKNLQEIKAEKGDLYVWVNSLDIEKFIHDYEILNIVGKSL